MPRGRPKGSTNIRFKGVESDDPLMQLAELMALKCGIPGCSAKNHLEEAQEYTEMVKKSIETSIAKHVKGTSDS